MDFSGKRRKQLQAKIVEQKMKNRSAASKARQFFLSIQACYFSQNIVKLTQLRSAVHSL